ncbi:MAG: RNA 2',3'-cyclic phosphodiesterase [Candidatus Eisenbacteria bacterium]
MSGTRAFLALNLPDDAVRSAAEVVTRMRERLGEREVKWVAAENLHLTLRFFGELDPEALQRARDFVRAADGGWEAIATGWSGLGAFPSVRRAQVIWLGIADERGELRALAAEVERGLVQAGFGSGDKPFAAHVTLGRVRRDARVVWPSDSERLTLPGSTFSIMRMALIKSTLTPSGPVYAPLETAAAHSS